MLATEDNRDGLSILLKFISLNPLAAEGESWESFISTLVSINFSFLERWLGLNYAIGIMLVIPSSSSIHSNLGESSVSLLSSVGSFLFTAYLSNAF